MKQNEQENLQAQVKELCEHGKELAKKGDFENAIIPYIKVTELVPKNAQIWYLLGGVYEKLNKHKDAFEVYKKAGDLAYDTQQKNAILCYTRAGHMSRLLKEDKQAIFYYKKVTEIDAASTDQWAAKGVAYTALRKNDEAIACYKESIKLKRDNIHVILYLGKIYEALGQNEEAAQYYTQAGNIWRVRENNDEAFKYYKMATELNPGNNVAWFNMSIIHMKKGERNEANFCSSQIQEIIEYTTSKSKERSEEFKEPNPISKRLRVDTVGNGINDTKMVSNELENESNFHLQKENPQPQQTPAPLALDNTEEVTKLLSKQIENVAKSLESYFTKGRETPLFNYVMSEFLTALAEKKLSNFQSKVGQILSGAGHSYGSDISYIDRVREMFSKSEEDISSQEEIPEEVICIQELIKELINTVQSLAESSSHSSKVMLKEKAQEYQKKLPEVKQRGF